MARKKEKPLTSAQREKVWEVINDCCDDVKDRPAQEVIEKDFNRDEDAYLRRMAEFHNIPLD